MQQYPPGGRRDRLRPGAAQADRRNAHLYHHQRRRDAARLPAAIISGIGITLTATYLGDIANRFERDPEFRIAVVFHRKRALDQVLRSVKDHRCSILDLQVRSSAQQEEARYRAIITARPRMRVDKNKLYAAIRAVSGVDGLTEIEISAEDMP